MDVPNCSAFLKQPSNPNSNTAQKAGRFDRWHLLSGTETTLLGRDHHCAIVIDGVEYPAVSREHALIRPCPSSVEATLRPHRRFPTENQRGDIAQQAPYQKASSAQPDWAQSRSRASDFSSPPVSTTGSNSAQAESCESNQWQICDLGSANGTYLNGRRIKQFTTLKPGDCIQLGQSGPVFYFECNNAQSRRFKAPIAEAIPPIGKIRKQPVPASSEAQLLTVSQLFPLLSTGSELTQKAYLVPGSLTVALVVSLFLTVGRANWFNALLASYIGFGAYYFVYRLCGKTKPWWLPILTAGSTVALLSTPLLPGALWLFRDLLPGAIPRVDEALPLPLFFTRMLIGAGLMEELLKALPLLGLGLLARGFPAPWRDRIGIWEPLDGILLGAASAVGFTLLETLGQYVPYMTQMSLGSVGETAGQLAGLQLLIPRLLGSVAGHVAYSGYFGYFIGLSAMRPRQRWLILAVGYGTASLLHALWNVMGSYSAFLLTSVGILSYACLVAAILKARALSPHRQQNFATRFFDGLP